MEAWENPWKPAETNENLWQAMKIYEHQRESIGSLGEPMKTYENHKESMTIWKSMNIYENQVGVYENQWMRTYEN